MPLLRRKKATTGRKIRIFFYCVKRALLVNYFQKYTFKVPASSHFLWNLGKFEIRLNQPRWPKSYIFNTPVQKEGNLPGFHIHTVCNLPFGHSSELKVKYLTLFKLAPTTSNMAQHIATHCNMVAKGTQHVAPNNVAIYMLRWNVAIVWSRIYASFVLSKLPACPITR